LIQSPGNPQPRLFIERAYGLLRLHATFLSLSAKPACFIIGHFMVSLGVLWLTQSGRAMEPILPSFTVEMYSPGEIVDGRRSYRAESTAGALLAAKAWISDGSHNATHLRIVDGNGAIMFDKLVAELV
jgi:hypothetical protein